MSVHVHEEMVHLHSGEMDGGREDESNSRILPKSNKTKDNYFFRKYIQGTKESYQNRIKQKITIIHIANLHAVIL